MLNKLLIHPIIQSNSIFTAIDLFVLHYLNTIFSCFSKAILKVLL